MGEVLAGTPRAERGLGRYGAVARAPHVAGLVASALAGRLPVAMTSLGLVLLVRQHGSYGRAGVVAALFAVAAGLAAVPQGRSIDRWGQTPVLTVCGLLFPAGLVLTVVAAERRLSLA